MKRNTPTPSVGHEIVVAVRLRPRLGREPGRNDRFEEEFLHTEQQALEKRRMLITKPVCHSQETPILSGGGLLISIWPSSNFGPQLERGGFEIGTEGLVAQAWAEAFGGFGGARDRGLY